MHSFFSVPTLPGFSFRQVSIAGFFLEIVNLPPVIKQLLDEVEHDIMNYQNRGLIIQTRGFDNS